MGREIRRVPANWEHPKYTADTARHTNQVGHYKPLFDEDFDHALNEWLREYRLWKKGKHPDQKKDDIKRDYPNYWDWNGGPPDPEFYRPKWSKAECTHLQVYETVSEGTPVSPHFATATELIEYLVAKGDFWSQSRGEGGWSREAAEAFVKTEWAPSAIMTGGKLYANQDALTIPKA